MGIISVKKHIYTKILHNTDNQESYDQMSMVNLMFNF
jgi:hypothetical protein